MADLVLSVDVTSLADAKRKLDGFQKAMNNLTVNRLAAGVSTLQSNIKQLVDAQARGIISTGAYEKGLLQIKRAYEQLGYSSQKATSEVRRFAAQLEQQRAAQIALTQAVQTSSRGMNAMGVGMQQAGYQVGDFLVQVQSGTNAFVAFGQQATQLVGILPMFNSVMGISGTRLIALSAGLGIAIPLVTALAAAFMRTRQSANSASGGYTTAQAAMQSAREETSRMADEIERLNRGLRSNTELFVSKAIEEQKIRVAQAQERVNSLEKDPDGLALAEEMLRREQQTLNTYEAQLKELEDKATQLDGITFQREQEVKSAQEALELEKQMSEELTRRNERAAEITRELNGQIRLNQLTLQYGEDSAQVEAERNRQARASFVVEQMRAGLSADQIASQLELLRVSQESADEAERIKDAIERVQDTNLASFNDQVRMLATLLGTSADEAARLLSNLPVGMTFGNRGALSGYTGAELLPPPRKEPRQRSGAGGQDPLQQLRERLKLEEDLLGKTEAQQRVIQALGANWRDYDESAVAALIATAEQLDNTNRKIAEQQSIADTIKDSMSDAFMSMVDGTKTVEDAFKGMARAIIKQLYDVLVVQQLVGSFNATSKTGTGIVGAIAGALFKESGGSMMAGRPYIVGERGPELVIPGRSATVANADLTRKAMGGSNGVTVVNNINVSGGTDPAAIRQEVAKLMPQITNATKTAVIDARRRGGQMKAAFS